jgi:lipopolysaccharide biosynthesis glycosyltransferase
VPGECEYIGLHKVSARRLTLVTACDRQYLTGTLALLGSLDLCEARLDLIDVVVLAVGMPNSDVDLLRRAARSLGVSLAVKRVTLSVSGYAARYSSPAVCARLDIPTVISDREWALYVDADVVFRRCPTMLSVAPDSLSCPVYAVQDLCTPTLEAPRGLSMRAGQASIGTPYFNSGVMLMHLDTWRNEDLGGRAVRLLQRRDLTLTFPDQDALNILLRERWRAIDRRWNVFPVSEMFDLWGVRDFGVAGLSTDDLLSLEADAWLLHYVTQTKPWHQDFPSGPNRDHWHRARHRLFD